MSDGSSAPRGWHVSSRCQRDVLRLGRQGDLVVVHLMRSGCLGADQVRRGGRKQRAQGGGGMSLYRKNCRQLLGQPEASAATLSIQFSY